jgi:hypothetical protein
VSYEALIAAQAKRLTKKRERGFMQYDWPSAEQITDRFDRMAWLDDCRTYADLYVPPAPERVELSHTGWLDEFASYKIWLDQYAPPKPVRMELSHTEWADGYKEWLAEQRAGIAALRADIAAAAMRRPCFAENEI